MTLNRRHFAQLFLAASGAGLIGPAASARGHHVVIGSGPAGAAAALALKARNPVTLVERDPGRFGPGPRGAFDKPAGPGLDALRRAGVHLVLDDVTGIDWRAARLTLFSGRSLPFDRLILAPGTAPVDEGIPGLDTRARHLWPAAWGSPREARRLSAQLAALPDAGHVVLRLPAAPSHPGIAVERALRLAAFLHRTRPAARLTVLDGTAGPDLSDQFSRAARRGGLAADWQAGAVLSVDAPRGIIDTTAGRLRADVVNFVPPQRAGRIAQLAGLTDDSGWCPVGPGNASRLRPSAHVLGDARKHSARTLAAARDAVA